VACHIENLFPRIYTVLKKKKKKKKKKQRIWNNSGIHLAQHFCLA